MNKKIIGVDIKELSDYQKIKSLSKESIPFRSNTKIDSNGGLEKDPNWYVIYLNDRLCYCTGNELENTIYQNHQIALDKWIEKCFSNSNIHDYRDLTSPALSVNNPFCLKVVKTNAEQFFNYWAFNISYKPLTNSPLNAVKNIIHNVKLIWRLLKLKKYINSKIIFTSAGITDSTLLTKTDVLFVYWSLFLIFNNKISGIMINDARATMENNAFEVIWDRKS